MAAWRLRGCPRCGGDLSSEYDASEADPYAGYFSCLMCGELCRVALARRNRAPTRLARRSREPDEPGAETAI